MSDEIHSIKSFKKPLLKHDDVYGEFVLPLLMYLTVSSWEVHHYISVYRGSLREMSSSFNRVVKYLGTCLGIGVNYMIMCIPRKNKLGRQPKSTGFRRLQRYPSPLVTSLGFHKRVLVHPSHKVLINGNDGFADTVGISLIKYFCKKYNCRR